MKRHTGMNTDLHTRPANIYLARSVEKHTHKHVHDYTHKCTRAHTHTHTHTHTYENTPRRNAHLSHI